MKLRKLLKSYIGEVEIKDVRNRTIFREYLNSNTAIDDGKIDESFLDIKVVFWTVADNTLVIFLDVY